MFTGIVQAVGEVRAVTPRGGDVELVFAVGALSGCASLLVVPEDAAGGSGADVIDARVSIDVPMSIDAPVSDTRDVPSSVTCRDAGQRVVNGVCVMDGDLTFESTPGAGTTFFFTARFAVEGAARKEVSARVAPPQVKEHPVLIVAGGMLIGAFR